MKSKVFVILQFTLIALIGLYAASFNGLVQNTVLAIGLLLGLWAVATLKFRVNIFPDVRDTQNLFINGPYKYIRHPMYTAVLLVTFSWVLQRPDVISIGMWLLLLLVLTQKLSFEEKLLETKFNKYRMYKQNTKRLIPFIY